MAAGWSGLSNGTEEIHAGATVVAAGAWSAAVLRAAGPEVEMALCANCWAGAGKTAVYAAVAAPAQGNRRHSPARLHPVGHDAAMSVLGTFHPEMLTTAVAPCRSAEFQVTVRVCDSPGNSVMSLLRQSEDCSSLSPGSSWPAAVPRRAVLPTTNGADAGEPARDEHDRRDQRARQ